jgi:8-amino-7-oxononanoate synthase
LSETSSRTASLFQRCDRFTAADELRQLGIYPYFRVVETEQGAEVVVDGRKMLMLGSNSYLGLTNHPKVKAAAIRAVEEFGTGCAGSRFLNGTLTLHVEAERRLAALVGKEAALVYSTGYQTNTGVLSCLLGKGAYAISDKLNHACIVDGLALSQAETLRFNHSDMTDLERRLREAPAEAPKLIVTDGVFSMEGDLCKLPEVVDLATRYGAQLMVDDAHGIGVLGPGGAGTAAHFGLTDRVDLVMGTFSKSLAAIGGFIAGSERVINYLKHHSRPFIFSASAAPASVAAVLAALDVMEEEPERLERLYANTRFLKEGLARLGVDTGPDTTPIFPVLVGQLEKCFQVCRWLHDEGMFINPVVPPAVPAGRTLIRLSVTAAHTEEQLAWALEKIAEAGRRFGFVA